MTDGISAYERQRLANIHANQVELHRLGLEEASASMKQQPVQRKKPKKARGVRTREQPTRSRSLGAHVSLGDGAIDTAAEAEARAGGLAWDLPSDRRPLYEDWEHVEYRKQEPCTPAERAALEVPEAWLADFEDFWLREGNSDENRRSVMKVVRKLIAGEGLTAKKHPELGTFLGGVCVDMRADFEALMAQAHAFLPMKSMPSWMQGRFPPAPAGSPQRSSNSKAVAASCHPAQLLMWSCGAAQPASRRQQRMVRQPPTAEDAALPKLSARPGSGGGRPSQGQGSGEAAEGEANEADEDVVQAFGQAAGGGRRGGGPAAQAEKGGLNEHTETSRNGKTRP